MLNSVAIAGGGPSGLFAAYLLKKRGLANSVTVFEQNPKNATYGFGVVVADRAMYQFKAFDEESFDAVCEPMVWLKEQRITHPDGQVSIQLEAPAGSIERKALLANLERLCETHGVEIIHEQAITSKKQIESYDLVIGADGANSKVRALYEAEFGTSTYYTDTRFAWYGMDHVFESSGLDFRSSKKYGNWMIAFYPYSKTRSTIVPECDGATWDSCGIAEMNKDQQRGFVEEMFADIFEGHKLIDNNSYFTRFRATKNQKWFHKNIVLVGDALFRAHFSIGSGTRMAMEDVIPLIQAIEANNGAVEKSLSAYVAMRKTSKSVLMQACEDSWTWYETFGDRLKLSANEFVYNYMMRTGRVDDDRLRGMAPGLMKDLEQERLTQQSTELVEA